VSKIVAFALALALALSLPIPVHAVTSDGSGDCSSATATVSGLDVGFENTHRHRLYSGTRFHLIRLRKYVWNVEFRFSYPDGSVVKVTHFGNGIYSSTVSVSAPNPGQASVSVRWIHRPTVLSSGRHWGGLVGPELRVAPERGTLEIALDC
jgi:hypothetical protein